MNPIEILSMRHIIFKDDMMINGIRKIVFAKEGYGNVDMWAKGWDEIFIAAQESLDGDDVNS